MDPIEIREWLEGVREDGAHIIELQHRGDATRVRSWKLEDVADLAALASKMATVAKRDAHAYAGGKITYVLYAYEELGKPYLDRHFLLAEGRSTKSDEEVESPSAQGVLAMTMRHHEKMAGLGVGQTADVIDHYREQLKAAHARVSFLEQKYFDVLAIFERLTGMEHERALAMRRAAADEKRMDFVKEKLDLLVPVMLGRLFARKDKDGKAAASPIFGEELVRQFLTSLREEQVDRLMGVLLPEQQIVVGELYQGYAQLEDKRKVSTADASPQAPKSASEGGAKEPRKGNGR
jgi:hypothetical protein